MRSSQTFDDKTAKFQLKRTRDIFNGNPDRPYLSMAADQTHIISKRDSQISKEVKSRCIIQL